MKLYLSETFLAATGFILLASAAFAGPFGLPDHEPKGYRDTGCQPEAQRAILSPAGEILYWNNPTCPRVKSAADKIELAVAEPEPGTSEPEAPAPEEPSAPEETSAPEKPAKK